MLESHRPIWVWKMLSGGLGALRIVRQEKKVLIGLCVVMGIWLTSEIGAYFSPYHPRKIGDVTPYLPPSFAHPLGSDPLGRDILTQLLSGAAFSIRVGFGAGITAFSIATLLGLTAGYQGGVVDNIINFIAEIFITMPSFAVLMVIIAVVGRIGVLEMSLVLAAFSWAYACKSLRAQALSLKERGFVSIAKISGSSGIEIVVRDILPNMLSFIGAWFAFTVVGAMTASAALELIGLGPQNIVSLGTILNWTVHHAALARGLVNWWVPPVVMLVLMFVGLYILATGLDEIGNPRLRVK